MDELHHSKATEFHQFLAYSGILVLFKNVHEDIYYEFLVLHCAYRLLSSPRHVDQNIDQANDLLELFVENFSIVFGPNSVSFNVHNLLHLASCAKSYGTLNSFSAYDYENKLQILKRYVRKPSSILQQILQKEKHTMYVETKTENIKYKGDVIIGAYLNDFLFHGKNPIIYVVLNQIFI